MALAGAGRRPASSAPRHEENSQISTSDLDQPIRRRDFLAAAGMAGSAPVTAPITTPQDASARARRRKTSGCRLTRSSTSTACASADGDRSGPTSATADAGTEEAGIVTVIRVGQVFRIYDQREVTDTGC